MPRPRKEQVSLSDTPYYHCISRCVRRAFLCGEDVVSGRSFEHRRQWVEDYLLKLAGIFSIDVCAFAVMSNHTHLVLHVDQQQALSWSMEEVLHRWHSLHKGTLLTQCYLNPELRPKLDAVQLQSVRDTAEIYRQRLFDLSWFMRHLNEHIAREANKEDQCTGRFWEGRFKSQALLDEAALAACMAYVDLNPIRAKIADKPETSAHTSVKQRIKQAKYAKQPKALYPFVGNPRNNMPKGLPFELKDYLALVDLTGRAIRQDKRGYISASHHSILERLNIDQSSWLTLTTGLEQQFGAVVGNCANMLLYKSEHKHQRLHGMGAAKRLLNSA
ncbi:transposase [Alginatibacterium sediminis]|uniref:Transposase n=1 Tax=Alginatibacterium sediminis TaxID=2164068 RepID=A0A420EGK2_9ALTE|nr:transposase [Alginatibacterium sediminis]RKF19803.1 transposase [Alginatibacterium sediminis]